MSFLSNFFRFSGFSRVKKNWVFSFENGFEKELCDIREKTPFANFSLRANNLGQRRDFLSKQFRVEQHFL